MKTSIALAGSTSRQFTKAGFLPYMDDVNSKAGFETGGANDRRAQHNLRLIFEKACQITAPFFDTKQSWGGSSLSMYARQTLRETFPELTQQEIAILFSAVSRFHKSPPKNS